MRTHTMDPLKALNTVPTGTWPRPAIRALISNTTAHSWTTLPAHMMMQPTRMPKTRMESPFSTSLGGGHRLMEMPASRAHTLKMIDFFVSFTVISSLIVAVERQPLSV